MSGSSELQRNSIKLNSPIRQNSNLNIKGSAKQNYENYSCDLKIRPVTKSESTLTCYFEKTSSCCSNKSGICPVDNRPCGANREYMDHVYGARFVPKPKPAFQAFRYSQQSQMHMYTSVPSSTPPAPERQLTGAERRIKRQKLFLMSTWLEDLLPNPSQGRSWMFNTLCDTLKIITRVGNFIVSFIVMLINVVIPSSSPKEKSQRDSTSQLDDHK
jgi:hypothetical protein